MLTRKAPEKSFAPSLKLVLTGWCAVAYRQAVQRAAVVLALQRSIATDLWATQQPGDLGAELRQGGGEARKRAGRQLRRRQRGQAYVQRAAPLLIYLVDPHLQGAPQGSARNTSKRRCMYADPQTGH